MPEPAVFEITLQSTTTEGEYRVVAQWRRPGELPVRVEESLRVDETLRVDEMQLGTSTVEHYGEVLGRAVFKGLVRDRFVQAHGDAPQLRVLLAVEAPKLQGLHWERLAGPEDERWRLLGRSQRTPLSLYIPSTSNRRFPPFGRRELRALVLVASPRENKYGAKPFDEATALDTVLEGLGEIPSVVLGKDPRAVGPPTLQELCNRLTAERFTLLHVVGHGLVSRQNCSKDPFGLLLEGEDGKPKKIPGNRLVEQLGELHGDQGLPHLAFLAVCSSAAQGTDAAFGGLAQQLVRELGMPAVVAMTDRVSQATALALGQSFYKRLRKHGEIDRALAEGCVAVRDEPDASVPALFSRLAGRPLFSDELDRPLRHAEVAEAARLLEGLFEARAPVLLDEVRRLATAVQEAPETLTGEARREYQAARSALEARCEDVLELSFSALAHGREPPAYEIPCPYPGLRPFTEEQRDFFCGRDALVGRLLDELRRQPFLAVLGSSGCGKSSLVMAGVLPRLRDEDSTLAITQLRPGTNPGARLHEALAELSDALDSLLYVDQLEEVFTLCHDEAERRGFFEQLLARVAPRHRVIVSMRADFIGACATYEALRARLKGLELIPPMTGNELRNAVEQQAQRAGLRYQTGLCELILLDVKGEPGAMPLLQHVLRGLYERRHGRWLGVNAYVELGHVRAAITTTAEAVWTELSVDDRDLLRATMLELADVRQADDGDATRYLRRRVSLDSLYATVHATGERTTGNSDAVLRLVDRLANERLLVKTRDETLGDVVEVAHEALLRSWERLQQWLEDNREVSRLRQEMEGAMARWHACEKARDSLEHVGKRGVLVRQYLEEGALRLRQDLKEYFDECESEDRRREEERERQQQEKLKAAQKLADEQSRRAQVSRRAVIGVGGVGLVAIIAAVVAWAQYRVAETSARRTREAVLVGYAREFRERDPTRAAVALAEVDSTDILGWRQEAVDVLQRPIATVLLGGHDGPVAKARFSPDGTHILAFTDYDDEDNEGTAQVWNSNGLGTPTVLCHDCRVQMADSSSESTRILIISNNKTLRVWNADGSGTPTVLCHDCRGVSPSLSPDGTRIVTIDSGRDRMARVWNADGSGTPILLQGVQEASFSPDGTRIVTIDSGRDRMARVWNADGSGRPIVLCHDCDVWAFQAFSPDGTRILTRSRNKQVEVRNVDGSGTPTVLQGADAGLSARFSPDGTHILTSGSLDDPISVWNANGSGTPIIFQEEVTSARFSPDGTHILTTSRDDTIHVRNADDSGLPTVLCHNCRILHEDFSPDGTRILTTGSWKTTGRGGDNTVWVRNADGSGTPTALRGHDDRVTGASFSPDGTRILTTSRDGTARLWNTDIPTVILSHDRWINAASFSPDGTRILTRDESDAAQVWNADGSGTPTILGHDDVIAASFSPNDNRIVTISSEKRDQRTVRVWNADGSGTSTVLGHASGLTKASFNPDGTRIVAVQQNSAAWVWNVDGSSTPTKLCHDCRVMTASFSPDGTSIVTVFSDKTAGVWDSEGSGAPIYLIGHEGGVNVASFSPDSTRVVTGSSDGTARVWNADGFGPPIVLLGHDEEVSVASFSPNGTHIVTGSRDKTARVWNADGSGTPTVLGHEDRVQGASFSPDGTRIVTTSMDGTVRVWNADGSGSPIVLRIDQVAPDSGNAIVAASFSPDGTRLLTASGETVRIFPIADALLHDLLKTATTVCISVDDRTFYLGETLDQARQHFTACELGHHRPAPTWD